MDHITVTLVVKGGDDSDAMSAARQKITSVLNDWFVETRTVPFPPGALLHYSIHAEHRPDLDPSYGSAKDCVARIDAAAEAFLDEGDPDPRSGNGFD